MKFCEFEKVYFWQNDLAAAALIIVYICMLIIFLMTTTTFNCIVFPQLFFDIMKNIYMIFSRFLMEMEEEITFYHFRYEILR